MTYSERHGKLMPDTPQTGPFDSLPLPHSRKVADTSTADLVRILVAARVAGVDPSKGRSEVLSAYAKHLEAIRKAAAEAAITAWLAAN